MKHFKQHIVSWRFKCLDSFSFHTQTFDNKIFSDNKIRQLRQDREHIHPSDILCRCVVFKFRDAKANTSNEPQAGRLGSDGLPPIVAGAP